MRKAMPMKSSRNAATSGSEGSIEPLPPTLPSMWRLCKLGFRYERRLMIAALVLSQLAFLPSALLALWLAWLGEGIVRHRPGLVLGASPRGSLGLFRAGQAMTAMRGENSVSIAQIEDLIEPVLAHRLIVTLERKDRWNEGSDVIREILAGKQPG